MGRHAKMQNDPTVQVLQWCGEHLMPLGLTADTVAKAGGDASIYAELRAAKAAEAPTALDFTEAEKAAIKERVDACQEVAKRAIRNLQWLDDAFESAYDEDDDTDFYGG